MQWSLNNGFPIRKAILNLMQHLQKEGMVVVVVVVVGGWGVVKHNITGYSIQKRPILKQVQEQSRGHFKCVLEQCSDAVQNNLCEVPASNKLKFLQMKMLLSSTNG